MSVVTDPVADILTRIRNANKVRHDSLIVPSSATRVLAAAPRPGAHSYSI